MSEELSTDESAKQLAQEIANKIGVVNACNAHAVANLMRDIAEEIYLNVKINPEDLEKTYSSNVDFVQLGAIIDGLANSAFEAGYTETAVDLARALKNLDENNVDALLLFSSFLIKSGLQEDSTQEILIAEKVMNRAMALDPKNYQVHHNMAAVFTLQGKQKQAQQHYLHAEKLMNEAHEQNFDLLASAASFFLSIGNTEHAKRLIEQCVKTKEGCDAILEAADVYQLSAMHDHAVAIYSTVLEHDKADWEVINRLGYSLLLQDKAKDARFYFEKALDKTNDQNNRSALFNNIASARILEYKSAINEVGNSKILYKTKQAIEQSLKLNPTNANAWNAYGMYYMEFAERMSGKKATSWRLKAKQCYLKAQQLGLPNSQFIEGALAEIDAKNGNVVEAFVHASNAMQEQYPWKYSSVQPDIGDYVPVKLNSTEAIRIANDVGGMSPLPYGTK